MKTNTNGSNSTSPILIPTDSYLEGYLKSLKSIRVECHFKGTILSQKKVIIDSTSFVTGDVICQDLILSGRIKGNVFCAGRVEMHPDSKIEGKVYTSTFTNKSETDSDFVIQIPRKDILSEIRNHLNSLTTENGLSKDELLSTIRNTFYFNVFAKKMNPDELIKHEFTEQLKIRKKGPKVVDPSKGKFQEGEKIKNPSL